MSLLQNDLEAILRRNDELITMGLDANEIYRTLMSEFSAPTIFDKPWKDQLIQTHEDGLVGLDYKRTSKDTPEERPEDTVGMNFAPWDHLDLPFPPDNGWTPAENSAVWVGLGTTQMHLLNVADETGHVSHSSIPPWQYPIEDNQMLQETRDESAAHKKAWDTRGRKGKKGGKKDDSVLPEDYATDIPESILDYINKAKPKERDWLLDKYDRGELYMGKNADQQNLDLHPPYDVDDVPEEGTHSNDVFFIFESDIYEAEQARDYEMNNGFGDKIIIDGYGYDIERSYLKQGALIDEGYLDYKGVSVMLNNQDETNEELLNSLETQISSLRPMYRDNIKDIAITTGRSSVNSNLGGLWDGETKEITIYKAARWNEDSANDLAHEIGHSIYDKFKKIARRGTAKQKEIIQQFNLLSQTKSGNISDYAESFSKTHHQRSTEVFAELWAMKHNDPDQYEVLRGNKNMEDVDEDEEYSANEIDDTKALIQWFEDICKSGSKKC